MAAGPATTQAVERVRAEVDSRIKVLTKNLAGYMDAAPGLIERYTQLHETCKSLNPRGREAADKEQEKEQEKDLPKAASAGSALERHASDSYTPLLERKPSKVMIKTAAQPPTPTGRAADTSEDARRRTLPIPPIDDLLVEQLQILTNEAYELRTVLRGIDDWLELQEPAVKKQQDPEFSVALEIQRAVRYEVIQDVKIVGELYGYETVFLAQHARYVSEYYKQPYAASYWWKLIDAEQRKFWDELERAWRQMIRVVLMTMKELANNHAQLSQPLDHNVMAVAFM
eukprot:TRINITY_DN3372_c0_g2_i1.p1 TRINITY_DN3372_c0_g2~~TRINITY_DN3372_c0_g2_i1.p1  ORF type:complete len:315 (+),score=131.19 TRINITY_DN3372_c0_g2_i1:92-946(+)